LVLHPDFIAIGFFSKRKTNPFVWRVSDHPDLGEDPFFLTNTLFHERVVSHYTRPFLIGSWGVSDVSELPAQKYSGFFVWRKCTPVTKGAYPCRGKDPGTSGITKYFLPGRFCFFYKISQVSRGTRIIPPVTAGRQG
jgi:hypothetical protein